ncbi:hypothetical protein ACFO4O_04285 [Glaciecola siphonariae]|uniref:DUF2730 family protein n=1 Tax=Glaciecola siphonariae TaxID=521012 RepID=A0ABV9LU53_9ALTE
MPELKDWIEWAITIFGILTPVVAGAIWFVYNKINKLSEQMAVIAEQTREQDKKLESVLTEAHVQRIVKTELADMRADMKSMTDSLLTAISTLDSRLNSVMLSMITGGKKE